MKRMCISLLFSTACLLVPASRAYAWWDFFAYLEELSGPGPFGGFELSFEIGCFEVGTNHEVSAKDINDYSVPLVRGSGLPPNVVPSPDDLRARVTPQIRAAILSGAFQATNDLATPRTVLPKKKKSTRGTSSNCHASDGPLAQRADEDARTAADKMIRILTRQVDLNACEKAPTSEGCRVAVRERGPRTGVVIGLARYKSRQNKLFDPSGPDVPVARTEGPQVRAWIVEGLVHHKLTRAVDVGAGAGITTFEGDKADGGRFESTHVHVVPFSVVVKPVAFWTTNRFGQAFGLRLGSRFIPGNLDGEDFGVAKERFSQRGELLWNISTYVDLLTLAHLPWGSR